MSTFSRYSGNGAPDHRQHQQQQQQQQQQYHYNYTQQNQLYHPQSQAHQALSLSSTLSSVSANNPLSNTSNSSDSLASTSNPNTTTNNSATSINTLTSNSTAASATTSNPSSMIAVSSTSSGQSPSSGHSYQQLNQIQSSLFDGPASTTVDTSNFDHQFQNSHSSLDYRQKPYQYNQQQQQQQQHSNQHQPQQQQLPQLSYLNQIPVSATPNQPNTYPQPSLPIYPQLSQNNTHSPTDSAQIKRSSVPSYNIQSPQATHANVSPHASTGWGAPSKPDPLNKLSTSLPYKPNVSPNTSAPLGNIMAPGSNSTFSNQMNLNTLNSNLGNLPGTPTKISERKNSTTQAKPSPVSRNSSLSSATSQSVMSHMSNNMNPILSDTLLDNIGNSDSQNADPDSGESGKLKGFSRRKKPPKAKFTAEDDDLLVDLKEKRKLTWKQIAEHFNGRTAGALQVRYCTKLKGRSIVWNDEDVEALHEAIKEYEEERWIIVSQKMGSKFTASICRDKFKQVEKI